MKAIFPGSFDPITNGHLYIIKKALETFDEIIVLVAENPNKKQQFSVSQRLEMIKDATRNLNNVSVDNTSGLTVDYAHKVGVRYIVRGYRNKTDYKYEKGLIELYKQSDPDIKIKLYRTYSKIAKISSSKVKELILNKEDVSDLVPNSVIRINKKR